MLIATGSVVETCREEAVRALTEFFERDLSLGGCAARRAEELVGEIAEHGFKGVGLQRWLAETGIRDAWNRALDDGRPVSLVPHLQPWMVGRTADVLSGSGTLTAALARCVDVKAFERAGAYPTSPPIPTVPLEELWDEAPGTFDTVLLAAVLHHELDPVALLDRIVAVLAPKRLVIVENCLSPNVSSEFHDFMDDFFNLSLNDIAVDCPGQHRDVEGWCQLLGGYGRARLIERLTAVPGMPFPYEVFVVDLLPRR